MNGVCGCSAEYQEQGMDCVSSGVAAKSSAVSGAAGGAGAAVIGGVVAFYFVL